MKDTILFLLQKHICHTSGELHDSEMSEREITEVGIILSVHTIIMLIINIIMLKQIFNSAVIATCVCHNNIIIHNYYDSGSLQSLYIVPLIASLR